VGEFKPIRSEAAQAHIVETRYGSVVLAAPPSVGSSGRPVTLLLHGAFRAPLAMTPLLSALDGSDAVFVTLPGHAGAPALAVTALTAWITALTEAVETFLPNRRILAVGESLGGLLAMALPVAAAVAFEPIQQTDKLWPIAECLEERGRRGLATSGPFIEMLRNQDYRWLGSKVTARTVVVAGSDPLLPRRPLKRDPSLLDDDDLALLAANPMIRTTRIAGGHVLLADNPAACREIVASALAEMAD
jgi:pimeloyl-ACP methyl ester carboxylesterase